MKPSRAILLFVAIVAAVVALPGCASPRGHADGTSPATSQPGSTLVMDGDAAGAATLRGVVTDDEGVPVRDVAIALLSSFLDAPLQVQSGAGGEFAFRKLQSGVYDVAAAKVGYEVSTLRVQLRDGETREITLVARAQPAAVAFLQAFEWRGNLSQLRYRAGATESGLNFNVLPNSAYATWHTEDRVDAIQDASFEVVWQSNQALSAAEIELEVEAIEQNDLPPADRLLAAGRGPSPLRIPTSGAQLLEALGPGTNDCLPNETCHMQATLGPRPGTTHLPVDASLTIDQTFTMAVSFFYRMPAPEGYSYFG